LERKIKLLFFCANIECVHKCAIKWNNNQQIRERKYDSKEEYNTQ